MIQTILQIIGIIAIVFFLEEVFIGQYGITIVKLTMSKQVRKRLRRLGELSENSLINIFRKSLAVYEFLWEAVNRGASIWIKEPDGSEKELDLK